MMDPVPVAQGGYGCRSSCDLNELAVRTLAEGKEGLNRDSISAASLSTGQRSDNDQQREQFIAVCCATIRSIKPTRTL